MVRTASTMLPLGTRAPDFALPSVHDGRVIALRDFAGAPATLVMFICNHCPYVKHVAPELARLGKDYAARGVAIIAISSNDAAVVRVADARVSATSAVTASSSRPLPSWWIGAHAMPSSINAMRRRSTTSW